MRMYRGWVLVFTIAAIAIVGTVWGADYFLKIDSIKGESRDDIAHHDWIMLESYSFGASQSITRDSGATGGGRTVAPPVFTDIAFTKVMDKASPVLALAACTGDPSNTLGEVVMELVESSGLPGSTQAYYVVTLSDCLVSSYQCGGSSSGGDRPTESLSLNFTKIQWEYKVQATGESIKAGWDLATNKKF